MFGYGSFMESGGLPCIYRIADPVVEAAVFNGLTDTPPDGAFTSDWEPSLPTLVQQRLAGSALHFADTHDIDLPPRVRATLVSARYRERYLTLLAELSAAAVAEVLRDVGVPFVVIKGPSIAAVDPVRGARPFVDADLLVPPDRFEDALLAARSAGFSSANDQPARQYYERHCYEGVNLVDASKRSIDIHHHVPPWWAGLKLTHDWMAQDCTLARIGGTDVPLASPTANLLIAALHLVSDRNLPGHKLLSWRDVMLATTLLDPASAATAVGAVGLGWWVRWVLGQMPATPSVTALAAALDATVDTRAPRTSAARIKALAASGDTGMNLAFAARLPAPNAAAYVAGQVLPSKASRASRLDGDESLLHWWRHVARSFTGRGGPSGGADASGSAG